MSDQPWSAIKGSRSAPYINSVLLPMASSAENYFSPVRGGVTEEAYLWLEAGTNFGVINNNPPSANHQSTTSHLVTILSNAGVSWKAYYQGIDGRNCPLNSAGTYETRFNPFVFFDDVTSNLNAASPACVAHVRPYNEFATDLSSNTLARYNFIKPDTCNSMHRDCPVSGDHIRQGDDWLAQEVPKILASAAYQNNGALFITWDRAATDDPIGMIVISPFAKRGYANRVSYTHGSTLRTFEEIFGLTAFLGDAANQTSLDDFFSLKPTVENAGITLSWSPSPGAVTYNVKRATTSGGPYTTIATGVVPATYTDRGLTSGTTYFYIVSAVNASGESTASEQVSATPMLVPPAPKNLTVRQTP